MKNKIFNYRSFAVILTTILLLIAMPVTAVFADTDGPRYPGTADTGGGSGPIWAAASTTLISALGADGGDYARTFLGTSDSSENLNMTNFGFSIPLDATIDGISVEMNRYASDDTGGIGVQDTSVRLIKAGVYTGDNKADLVTIWPTSPSSTVTYGGTADLWGTTWTPAQINALDFGVTLDVLNNSASSRTGYVDYVRITVTYTAAIPTPTTTTLSALSPVTYGNAVTFEATVIPAPTDGVNVEFYDGITLLGTGTTSAGEASYTTSTTQLNAVDSPHSITAKFVGNASYLESTSAALDQVVNPKTISVTALAKSKTYGNSDPALTYTNDPLAGSDSFSGALSRVAGENVSTYAITQGALTAGPNYIINFTGAVLTINPKAITITADPGQAKAFGAADPVFTYTADPLVGSDTFSGALSRVAGEAVGFYAITQGTLTASSNYTLNFFSNDFGIVANQAPVITEGTSINVTMSKNGFPDKFSLTLNATDLESNLITWSISSAAANGTATASGTGTSKAIGYTPTLNFSGADSFAVQVADGFGGTDTITVNVTVSAGGDLPTFADVQMNGFGWAQIEAIYAAGITGGCSTNPLNYCPNNSVTRAQMAVFLLRGIHGSSYSPPAATGAVFGDVPSNAFAAAWIEQLVAEGITAGCGAGNYCPDNSVTRAQMAVFLLRAKYGAAYSPPAATGTVFTDVPSNAFAAAWIEQLVSEGVTAGCGGGNYCPDNAVTRAQMAVFLQRTFNLPLP